MLMKLKHKNIISYLGMNTSGKTTYFVMELCQANLKDFRSGRILIRPEISVIMKEVLTALDYLHRNRIVHRSVSSTHSQ